MSYINQPFTVETGTPVVIQMGRWSYPAFTLQVSDIGTLGTLLVEGTLSQINRGDTPVWATLNDLSGSPITAQVVGIVGIENTPLEAIRLTASVDTVSGRLAQTGSE